MAKIGFIGIGNMGRPMAKNLIKGGHALRVFDIVPPAAAALEADGAMVASSPADCARDQDFVITMVPNSEHVQEALFANNEGAASAMNAHTLYIDMSTILPTVTDTIHDEMQGRGIPMIDAPVGRPQEHAITGTLLIMAGGDPELIERARPVLACMGSDIVHCGGPGAGSRMKVVNNYMSTALNGLTAEALTLAETSGLDLQTALDVMETTAASKGHMHTTYPGKVLARDKSPGFMVDLALKDLDLAIDLADQTGAVTDIGKTARGHYQTARDQGRGRDDWTTLYEAVRERAGLEPKL